MSLIKINENLQAYDLLLKSNNDSETHAFIACKVTIARIFPTGITFIFHIILFCTVLMDFLLNGIEYTRNIYVLWNKFWLGIFKL